MALEPASCQSEVGQVEDKDIEKQARLAEYNSVREETVKRVELSYQIINLNFVAAGALWAVGTAFGAASVVLVLYPWLALFLAAQYGANNFMIVELGVYTREAIEKSGHDLGWASYLESRLRTGKLLNAFSVIGIFAGTSAISLLTYEYVTAKADPSRNVLSEFPFWLGWFATALTLVILCVTLRWNPIYQLKKVGTEQQEDKQ